VSPWRDDLSDVSTNSLSHFETSCPAAEPKDRHHCRPLVKNTKRPQAPWHLRAKRPLVTGVSVACQCAWKPLGMLEDNIVPVGPCLLADVTMLGKPLFIVMPSRLFSRRSSASPPPTCPRALIFSPALKEDLRTTPVWRLKSISTVAFRREVAVGIWT
jgi:hypothetical protein